VSAGRPAPPDADWWAAHGLVASFGVLVAAILAAVPGWSAPLHAWVTLAAFVIGVLACHALARAVQSGWRRQWRPALLGLGLAAGLCGCAAGLMLCGHRGCAGGDPFAEAPAVVPGEAR